MKKSKKILLAIFMLIALVYIAIENYNREPANGQLTKTPSPEISGEIVINLVGPKWNWERIVTGENEIIFPRAHEAFAITFTEDGRLDGTTDCNGFSSQYKKDGNNIEFGLFAANQMYCENSQEEIFKNSLSKTEKYYFGSDGKLILESASSSIFFVNKDSEKNKKNWNLIKVAALNCDIKEAGQTHDRKVRVTLKNGDKLEAYSPKIDNIFDIVGDAKEKCGKVMLWTE